MRNISTLTYNNNGRGRGRERGRGSLNGGGNNNRGGCGQRNNIINKEVEEFHKAVDQIEELLTYIYTLMILEIYQMNRRVFYMI